MKATVAFGDGVAVRLTVGGAGPIDFGLQEGMNQAGLGRVVVTVAGRAVLAVEATGKPGEIQVGSLLEAVKKEPPAAKGARGKKHPQTSLGVAQRKAKTAARKKGSHR